MNDKNEIINLYKNAKEVVNLSHEERLQLNISEKKSIAEKALIFVHNNKKYFLDSSTSVQLLANLIEKSAEHQKYQRKAIYKGLDLKDIHIIILDDISSSHFADIMNSENIKIKPETLLIM